MNQISQKMMRNFSEVNNKLIYDVANFGKVDFIVDTAGKALRKFGSPSTHLNLKGLPAPNSPAFTNTDYGDFIDVTRKPLSKLAKIGIGGGAAAATGTGAAVGIHEYRDRNHVEPVASQAGINVNNGRATYVDPIAQQKANENFYGNSMSDGDDSDRTSTTDAAVADATQQEVDNGMDIPWGTIKTAGIIAAAAGAVTGGIIALVKALKRRGKNNTQIKSELAANGASLNQISAVDAI